MYILIKLQHYALIRLGTTSVNMHLYVTLGWNSSEVKTGACRLAIWLISQRAEIEKGNSFRMVCSQLKCNAGDSPDRGY